ncbi:GDSL esterase/lipase At4g01130-like [Salvia miltiorrhiza]|uniref:GDSL esterase/lipase At4g01130-like n=1 Tax=Salvia miltiorrhiza TaxID=226208 RepID=UPI0025AD7099|nr:GDSL esterase/lipase At4g01130-like [Salvia miltiorrhiza]
MDQQTPHEKHAIIFRQFLVSWIVLMTMSASMINAKCSFEAIFAFGDSNTDTGGFFAAFPSQPSPNGMTYFSRPTGRPSDGRLYIDFLTQALGLPFLSPYLQSVGSDFRHGVNFATSASTVLQPNTSLFVSGVSPFYLAVQINQMKHFKARVEEFKSQGQTNLPQPDIFGKALYVIYIGQNDFTGFAGSAGAGGVKQVEPQIVSHITSAVKDLYRMGGRTFMVLNLAPVGCFPAYLEHLPHAGSDIDQSGCMASYNNAVKEYNSLLKAGLEQARQELSDANLLYVDTNSVLLELFTNPTSHGTSYGTTACCGYGGGSYNFNQHIFCGYSKVIEGRKATASACGDPQNYVIWDGVHLTEAANKMMAYAILSGSYFEPAFSLNNYCDIQPIG